MNQIQAILYLIGAVVVFAAMSYGFYRLMVLIFQQMNRK
jgi:hypothetical protein